MAARSSTDALGLSQGFIITLSIPRNTTDLPPSSYTLQPHQHPSAHFLLFPLYQFHRQPSFPKHQCNMIRGGHWADIRVRTSPCDAMDKVLETLGWSEIPPVSLLNKLGQVSVSGYKTTVNIKSHHYASLNSELGG